MELGRVGGSWVGIGSVRDVLQASENGDINTG